MQLSINKNINYKTGFLLIIIIIIIIMSCRQHRYPWPSLATSPYRSSPRADLPGYIPYPHKAAVCIFELVVLFLLGHMWGSIGVYHFWLIFLSGWISKYQKLVAWLYHFLNCSLPLYFLNSLWIYCLILSWFSLYFIGVSIRQADTKSQLIFFFVQSVCRVRFSFYYACLIIFRWYTLVLYCCNRNLSVQHFSIIN